MSQLQIAIPTRVMEHEIARCRTFGKSIELCAHAAGYDLNKELQQSLHVDKGQFARWKSGQEGIQIDKFFGIMDFCGNDAPLLWINYQRGYELSSLRKRESETESLLRLEREKNAELERKLEHFQEFAGMIK